MSDPNGNDSGSNHTRADLVVIIPAMNEEESLPNVLRDLPPVDRVIVCNNGSTDRTAEVAADCEAEVVDEPRRGYGSACLRGIAALAEADPAPETIVIFLDADYSDHPDQLPMVVSPIQHGAFDFVIGSRMTGNMEPGAMPFQACFGNRLATFLIWLLLGYRYTDLGPFRAIRWDCLQALKMKDTNFGWTVEMQIKAIEHKLRIHEVPVDYRRRIGHSKISGTISGTVRAGYKILGLIAVYGIPAFFRRLIPA